MPVVMNDQASHTYGVLDPLMHERRDTKFVYAGLDTDTRNVIMLPQGGYLDRGGSIRKGRARKPLTAVDLSAATPTAPNGGNASHLLDGNEATVLTTNSVSGNPFVLFTLDLGAPRAVAAFDLIAFRASAGGADAAVKVQYHDGGGWSDFGVARGIRGTERSRRFAGAPGTGATARNWRAVVVGAPSIGAVSIAGCAVHEETAAIGPGRLFRAGPSDTEFYELVITPGNIDVFQRGAYRASCATAITAAMLQTVKVESGYDTVLLFHRDLRSERLVRQGSDSEWTFGDLPYENVPLVDYGGDYANAVTEIQEVAITSLSNGQFFELTLEGNATAPIAYNSTPGITVTAIRDALEALTTVDPGLTVTHVSGNVRFRITFNGGRNAGRAWATMTGLALDNPESGFVTVRTILEGRPGGEPIISDERGWPGVGRFAESRLVLAGLRERPLDVLASVTGDVFNLDVERAGAAAALSFTLDADEESTIRDLLYRRSLMVFTQSGVFYNAAATLSAEEVPQFRTSDAPGIDANTRPRSLSNAIYYIHSGGHSLVQLTFSELEQDFIGEPASVLSTSLVDTPLDMTISRANARIDSDVLRYVNADGALHSVTIMRTQDVSGFGPHATRGLYRSMLQASDGSLWQLVERALGTGDELCLEEVNEAGMLDCSLSGTNDPASATITGLERYDGLQLAVVADGRHGGFHTVTGGAVTLAHPVTAWTVGLWLAPRATDLPFRRDTDAERPMARLKRVARTRVSVLATTSLAVAANGCDPVDLPLHANRDMVFDTLPEPKTGVIHAEGWPGWTEAAQVTVTQLFPGKLTVRGVRKDVVV